MGETFFNYKIPYFLSWNEKNMTLFKVWDHYEKLIAVNELVSKDAIMILEIFVLISYTLLVF